MGSKICILAKDRHAMECKPPCQEEDCSYSSQNPQVLPTAPQRIRSEPVPVLGSCSILDEADYIVAGWNEQGMLIRPTRPKSYRRNERRNGADLNKRIGSTDLYGAVAETESQNKGIPEYRSIYSPD